MIGQILGYLATGLVAGLTAGMIGVGGGVVTVPFLDFIWTARGASGDTAFAVARGTSLAIMVFSSFSAAYGHWRRGKVRLPWAWRIAAGGLVGAAAGTLTATIVSAAAARASFGLLALFVSYRFFHRKKGAANDAETDLGEPPASVYALGLLIGSFSAFFGVGGGIICVPLLVRFYRFSILEAVATSSTLIVGMGLAGGVFYAIAGTFRHADLAGCVGYVDPTATALIAVSAVLFARLGVLIVHRMDARRIELLFAFYALAIGVKMLAFS